MNDNLQDELGRTLHRQADGVSGAPISFEAVRGTAGRIRNRRRAMAAGAVLAVGAAIAAPTALMGGFGEDRGSNPPVVGPSDPAPSQTTKGTYPDGLTLRGLEQGDAPRVAWLEGEVLHLPEGRDVRLDTAYDRIANLGGRWLAYTRDDGKVSELDTMQFEAVRSWPATADFVVGDHGAAWLSGDGFATVLPSRAPEVVKLGPFDFGSQLVAITGDCGTDPETTNGGGCALWWNFEDAGGAAFMTMGNHTEDGRPASGTLVLGKDVRATDGSVVRVGITEVKSDTSTCSALTETQGDSETERVAWTTCDHRPMAFSPDGETLLAFDTIGDGIGEGVLAFLSADDGKVLLDLNNHDSHAFYNNAVWEDDAHVLVTVFQEGEWAMVRIGTDGSMEYAVAPRPGSDLEVPYVMATQP